MANVLDVKTRDYDREIAADDPLMELSRIMGFDKPYVASEREPADPQIAIEDSFSMDLERELALDEIPGESTAQLDSEFNAAFEEELSEAIQFGEDAPSVVPSLEDELSALLDEEPLVAPAPAYVAPEPASAFNVSAPVEPDNSWLEEDLELTEAPVAPPAYVPAYESARAEEPWPVYEPVVEAIAQETVELDDSWLEDNMEAEVAAPVVAAAFTAEDPWADVNLDDQLEIGDGEADFAEIQPEKEPELELSKPDDYVLADMNRASPEVYQAVEPETDEAALDELDFDFSIEDTAPAVEPSFELPVEKSVAASVPAFDNWKPLASTTRLETARIQTEDFNRLVAETAPEPVVDSSEPLQDAVAQTDDFDIPDFEFTPEPPYADTQNVVASDFEPEYSGYEPKSVQQGSASVTEADFDFESMLDEQLAAESGVDAATYGAAAGVAAAATMRPRASERVDADIDFQPFGGEAPAFPEVDDAENAPRKKSWLVPAVIAGVVLLGGGVYYAFSGNGTATSTSGPALVKADPQPVKIAPENPGGKSVPDQDKAVYDKVEGEQAALPSQGTLVSESEEPVDIASVASDAPVDEAVDTSAKSEARVDPATQVDAAAAPSAETAAVTPKKVRTFIVKPDGTLVERPADTATPAAVSPAEAVPTEIAADQPVAVPAIKPAEKAVAPIAEVPAAAEPVAVASAPVAEAPAKVAAPAEENLAKLAAAVPAAPAEATPVAAEPEAAKPEPAIKVVKTKKIKVPAAETTAASADGAPVIESRPSDQPVTIVGKTGGPKAGADETQLASADAAPVAASGGYAIQIASTPSPEAAKSTYAALNRKYLNVIGGRGVNIQKAEVTGKGTVYRVRIPAGSKQEAAALCAQYKASGGSCFVTK
jgi:hypothetical protein